MMNDCFFIPCPLAVLHTKGEVGGHCSVNVIVSYLRPLDIIFRLFVFV